MDLYLPAYIYVTEVQANSLTSSLTAVSLYTIWFGCLHHGFSLVKWNKCFAERSFPEKLAAATHWLDFRRFFFRPLLCGTQTVTVFLPYDPYYPRPGALTVLGEGSLITLKIHPHPLPTGSVLHRAIQTTNHHVQGQCRPSCRAHAPIICSPLLCSNVRGCFAFSFLTWGFIFGERKEGPCR